MIPSASISSGELASSESIARPCSSSYLLVGEQQKHHQQQSGSLSNSRALGGRGSQAQSGAGSQRPQSPRRGYLGWIEPGAAAVAATAGAAGLPGERASVGTVCKLPALAGPCAARPPSAPRRNQGRSSWVQATRKEWKENLFKVPTNPSLFDLPNFSRLLCSRFSPRQRDSGAGTFCKFPAHPGRALSQF